MRYILHLWAGITSLSETTKRTGVRSPQEVPKVLEDRHHLCAHMDDEFPTISTIMGSILRHTILQCSTHKHYKPDDQFERCKQPKMRLSWWIPAERSIQVHADMVQSATR